MLQAAFRECLDNGDALRLLQIYGSLFPKLPKPADIEEAQVILHQARTGAESVKLEKRLYSHAWLDERRLKSSLPDELKPPKKRIFPIISSAVGVAVKSFSRRSDRVEEAASLEQVMARAAGDMVRDGIYDRARIAPVMWAARDAFINGRMRREI